MPRFLSSALTVMVLIFVVTACDKNEESSCSCPAVGNGAQSSAVSTEMLVANYDQPLEKAIAVGAFVWKSEDITSEHFPNAAHETGEVTLTVKLFHFDLDRQMFSDYVVKEMNKEGYRPATLRELLAYAVKNPDEQRKDAIYALGSSWSPPDNPSLNRMPCLGIDGRGRGLGLGMGGYWPPGRSNLFRFLAVRRP